MRDAMEFWRRLGEARNSALNGVPEATAQILADIRDNCLTEDQNINRTRIKLLQKIARTCAVPFSQNHPADVPRQPVTTLVGELDCITAAGPPGISLVTCSMNRTDNLLRAIPSWISKDEISEIIVVDWSSSVPVSKELHDAGVSDPRLRVIRVENEARWILSYAFNIGFRLASYDKVLKVDADIVLEPNFFKQNQLTDNQFIAGNWRCADAGQEHINGFFYAHKKDLAAISGFNEFITTYGWDDDDLYERLSQTGLVRQDVDATTIHHLPHSDATRIGRESDQGAAPSGWREIHDSTMHSIRTNRFLANVMPHWGEGQEFLPFKLYRAEDGATVLRRKGFVPSEVPPHIHADADFYATQEMASWRLGRRVLGLDRARLNILLEKPFIDLGPLEVEIALSNKPEAAQVGDRYLVAEVENEPSLDWSAEAYSAFARLEELAKRFGLTLVLRGPFETIPDTDSDRLKGVAFISSRFDIGSPRRVDVSILAKGQVRRTDEHLSLTFDEKAITVLNKIPSPSIGRNKPRFFIDAQHGLGNRMRAIGSAACIAKETNRELVVVWHPDAHCECRMSDLFEYDGAVEEESFTKEAERRGCAVYNYMEIEPGAEKNALIDVDQADDIYARSAYVLNSPLSNWEEENRFLRSLTPVAAVRDLVSSVRTPNDLSAHVRMVGGTDFEHLAYESLENWTEEGHAQTDFWRKKSHYKHFITRIDTLIAEGRAERIFLAADKPETYAEFKACFGDRVAMLEREVYDRSAEQLRYALADVLLLGSSPLLLGSSWSSFSELAMRLSPQKMQIEMSGKDF